MQTYPSRGFPTQLGPKPHGRRQQHAPATAGARPVAGVPQRLARLRVRRLAAARQCMHCGSSGAGLRRTPSDQPRAGRTLRLVAASPRRGGARARPATPCRADFWPAARRNASALPAVRPSSALVKAASPGPAWLCCLGRLRRRSDAARRADRSRSIRSRSCRRRRLGPQALVARTPHSSAAGAVRTLSVATSTALG